MPTRKFFLALILFALAGTLTSLAATPTYIVAPSYAVGNFPNAGAVGDVNNDGKLDIVTVNSVDGNLSALLGNGNGTFLPAISSGRNLGGSQAMVMADFNDDGFLDVATAGNPSTVSILLGNGTGSFTSKGTVPLAGEGFSLAAADFNGDGKIDLVVATLGKGVSVLLGNGDGTFQAPVLYPAGVGPNDVAVADFNGDGRLDLAVANFSFSSASITLLLGNGNGSFQAATNVATGSFDRLAAGDLNGDGKVDLVAVVNTSVATVFLGNGNGTFQKGVNYDSGSGSTHVAIADENGDGHNDIVVGRSSGISTLFGNGDGTFQAPTEYASGGSAMDVLLGDFNGDSKPDAATPNTSSNNVSVFLNNGSGAFPGAPRVFELNDFPVINSEGAIAANFNSDGKKDIAALTNGSQTGVHVLLGNGDGTFQPQIYTAVGVNPAAIAAGDFNKDHNIDVVVSDGETSQIYVLLGKGDGTFQSPVAYNTAASADGVAVADLNQDGILDLLVVIFSINPKFNFLEVYLGNGDGTFKPGVTYPIPGPGAHTVTVGDINKDGKMDAIVGCNNLNGGLKKDLFIFLGNGDGTFKRPTSLSVDGSTDGVVLGDFNKDGKLDLAVNGYEKTWVLLGNGNGTFQTAKSIGISGSGIKMLDVNGDGKQDLAIVDFNTNTEVFLGNGDGTFQTGQVLSAGGLSLDDKSDFNGDGALDLVQTTFLGNGVTVLLNSR